MMNILLGVILFITIAKSIDGSINNVLPASSFYHNPQYRFQRANDEEFSTSVDQMQMIARVTNGIYLQQGLLKGKIPSDDLISELLNFGTVTPSQIHEINTDTLKKVIQGIQELPGKLKGDKAITKMEDRLLVLSSVVEKSKGVDALERPSNEYLTAVQSLNTSGINWNLISGYVTYLEVVLKSIKTIEESNQIELNKIEILFDGMLKPLQKIKDENLDPFKTAFNSEVLKNFEDSFAIIFQFHDSVKKFSDNAKTLIDKVDDEAMSSVSNNMKELDTVINNLKNDPLNFGILIQMFVSRHHRSGNTKLEYTPGLSNGFSDIDLIFNDLKNEWIKTAVDGQSENLAKSMEQLKSIGKLSRETSDSLGSQTDEQFRIVDDTVTQIDKLSQLTVSIDPLASKLADILTAIQTANLVPASFQKFDDLIMDVSLLFQQLKAIKPILTVWETLKSTDNAPKFEKVISIITYSNKDELPAKLKELKESQDFKDIEKIVKGVEQAVEILSKKKAVSGPAKYIVDHFSEFDTYIQESANFLAMLKSLRDIEGSGSIGEIIEVVRMFRGAKIGSFDTIIDSIGQVKQKLTDLQNAINEMKGFKSPQSDVLFDLDDVSKDSKDIGSATRGIFNMKNALNDKVDFNHLKSIGRLVNAELTKVKLEPEDETTLKTLVGLGGQLELVYKALNNFKSKVSTSTSSKLSDHSGIFTEAKNVPGFNEDLMKMSVSVEKLAVAIQVTDSKNAKLLRDIKPSLVKLDTIGLDYSKYTATFDGTKNTLTSLDLFYANHAKKYDPKVNLPPSGGKVGPRGKVLVSSTVSSIGAITGAWNSVTTAASAGDGFIEKNWYYFLIGFFVCAAVAIGISLWLWKRHEKKKQGAAAAAAAAAAEAAAAAAKKKEDDENARNMNNAANRNSNTSSGSSSAQENPAGQPPGAPAGQGAPHVQAAPNGQAAPNDQAAPVPEVPAVPEVPDGQVPNLQRAPDNQVARELRVAAEGQNPEVPVNLRVTLVVARYAVGLFTLNARIFRLQYEDRTVFFRTIGVIHERRSPIPRAAFATARLYGEERPFHKARRVVLTGYGNRFGSDVYHANRVDCPNGLRFVLGKTPKTWEEVRKFYWMIVQENSEYMIMLGAVIERSRHTCIQFYPEDEQEQALSFDGLTVTCLIQEGYRRELKIEFDGQKPHILQFYQISDWIRRDLNRDRVTPQYASPVNAILKEVRGSRAKPVFIACEDGASRSGVIPFIEMSCQLWTRDVRTTFQTVLNYVRARRAGAIENVYNFEYAIYCAYEIMSEGYCDLNDFVNEMRRYISQGYDACSYPERPRLEQPEPVRV